MILWKNNKAPALPYYAVIFVSEKKADLTGYAETNDRMMTLVQELPGYLGYESVKQENKGIFISYWQSMESIESWKNNKEHNQAKADGIKKWYHYYHSLICKVEHETFLIPEL